MRRMGRLDEAAFAAHLAPCSACGGARLELKSYLDQRVPVMLAEAAGAPTWVHDGEKFVDGTYEIACATCRRVVFTDADCPRCHTANGLTTALATASRIPVPRSCPQCKNKELSVLAMTPAATVHAGGPAKPRPIAELGEAGVHVVAIECDDCGLIADVGDRCPLCDAPGPLRERP
jgi:hypothetical protein